MAGHAVVPQLTVPSAPHRHIRRDSTADVGILSRAAADTEARAASRPRGDLCDAGRWRARMHLYAAFLGGPLAGGRMGEGHEVALVRPGCVGRPRRPRHAGGNGRTPMEATCT